MTSMKARVEFVGVCATNAATIKGVGRRVVEHKKRRFPGGNAWQNRFLKVHADLRCLTLLAARLKDICQTITHALLNSDAK